MPTDAREEDERRLRQLRGHEISVAQDHRREDAARGRAQDRQLEQQGQHPERTTAPRKGPAGQGGACRAEGC